MTKAKTVAPKLQVKIGGRKDISTCVDIDDKCFDAGALDADEFKDLLSNKKLFIAVQDDVPIGYILFEVCTDANMLAIARFCVLPQYQRDRVGTYLLNMISKAHAVCDHDCAVPESNLTAQLFLKANSYKCTKILKDFYESKNESAGESAYYFERERTTDVFIT